MTEFLHEVVRERNWNQNVIDRPDPLDVDPDVIRPTEATYTITDRGSQALSLGQGPF